MTQITDDKLINAVIDEVCFQFFKHFILSGFDSDDVDDNEREQYYDELRAQNKNYTAAFNMANTRLQPYDLSVKLQFFNWGNYFIIDIIHKQKVIIHIEPKISLERLDSETFDYLYELSNTELRPLVAEYLYVVCIGSNSLTTIGKEDITNFYKEVIQKVI